MISHQHYCTDVRLKLVPTAKAVLHRSQFSSPSCCALDIASAFFKTCKCQAEKAQAMSTTCKASFCYRNAAACLQPVRIGAGFVERSLNLVAHGC